MTYQKLKELLKPIPNERSNHVTNKNHAVKLGTFTFVLNRLKTNINLMETSYPAPFLRTSKCRDLKILVQYIVNPAMQLYRLQNRHHS